jgi:hypothetical protein
VVTEAEWLTCTDPTPMLEFLRGKSSDRKSRLLRVGAARSIWAELTDKRYRAAVEVAERYADGLATDDELDIHKKELYGLFGPRGEFRQVRPDSTTAMLLFVALACVSSPRVMHHVYGGSWMTAMRYTRNRLSPIIRDQFGNPFRPVTADPNWLTSTAVTLARTAYEDRAFDRLPILADALEEAGCDDAGVLNHLRGDGPHVRGCWVIDMLLGKG